MSATFDFRKQATARIRQLESQLAEAACSGLTNREHFAAMAMQGLLAQGGWNNDNDGQISIVCRDSIRYADALIAGLESVKP